MIGMNTKAAIKIIIVLAIFILIEFLRLGYMKKDQAQEAVNQNKFEVMSEQITDLQEQVTELEVRIAELEANKWIYPGDGSPG